MPRLGRCVILLVPLALGATGLLLSLHTEIGYAILGGMVEGAWTPAQMQESKRRGDILVAALQRYRLGHDSYPSSLDELVPGYVNELPPPTAGAHRWFYLRTANSFRLSFGSPRYFGGDSAYPSCYSDGDGWRIDN